MSTSHKPVEPLAGQQEFDRSNLFGPVPCARATEGLINIARRCMRLVRPPFPVPIYTAGREPSRISSKVAFGALRYGRVPIEMGSFASGLSTW